MASKFDLDEFKIRLERFVIYHNLEKMLNLPGYEIVEIMCDSIFKPELNTSHIGEMETSYSPTRFDLSSLTTGAHIINIETLVVNLGNCSEEVDIDG